MITQASSEHSICIGISSQDAVKSQTIISEEFENEINNIKLIKPINASMEDIKKNVINKVA